MPFSFLQLRRDQLQIVPATLVLVQAESESLDAFARHLCARIAVDWPPPLTADTVEPCLCELRAGPEGLLWGRWYVILDDARGRELIGVLGCKGPPLDRTVEIGYSIVASHHGRGLATGAVALFLDWLRHTGAVDCVCAHTLPTLAPSIRVLQKNGFTPGGPATDPEPGAVRFERRLAAPA